MELISREEAMEAVRAIKEVMLTNGEVINALYHVPTIESRPKGEWNWHGDEDICNCPYCDFEIDAEGCIDPVEYVKIYNYCPHCGADMRGKE